MKGVFSEVEWFIDGRIAGAEIRQDGGTNVVKGRDRRRVYQCHNKRLY